MTEHVLWGQSTSHCASLFVTDLATGETRAVAGIGQERDQWSWFVAMWAVLGLHVAGFPA